MTRGTMKHVIIYWSRYGNGKRIVEQLSKALGEKGDEVILLSTDEADPTSLPEADIYTFSSPTEMMNVQKNMRKFMKKLGGMEGKTYGIINTHQMESKNWLPKMEKMLDKKGMTKKAELDILIGKEAKAADGLREGWERKVEEFADRLIHK